jgi:hypothetical protein
VAKYYLNKTEREFFIWAVNLAGFTGDKADEFEQIGRKEIAKWLRTARSFLLKVTDSMAKPLESHTRDQIYREMKSYQPMLVHSKDFNRMAREMTEASRKIEAEVLKDFPRENVYDLAEITLDKVCKQCDGHKPDCHLQKIYSKLEIPPFDESGERCEFKID